MKDKYDAIIIGAGIGGLVCGCYLAKAGKKVLIVEQHYQAGGYCTSFKRNDYAFDVGVHYLGAGRKSGELGKLMKELSLDTAITFSNIDPCDKIIMPDFSVTIHRDARLTIEEIKKISGNEKNNVDNFFDFIATKNFYDLYATCKKITFKDLLDRYFKDHKIKALLSVLLGNIGLPPSRVAAISAAALYREFILDPGYYPRGGMQSFANALVKRFEDFGGELRLKTKAKKIVTKNGKVTQVLLDTEETCSSDYVVSNVDAYQTYNSLLDVKLNNVCKRLDSMEPTFSAIAVYLGISKNLKDVLESKCSTWYFTTYDIEECYGDPIKNITSDLPSYVVLIFPSFHDQAVVSSDKTSMVLFSAAPFLDKNFWETNKKTIAKKLIAKSQKLIPSLSTYIEIMEIATPQTFYNYTSNQKGALYGWACTIGQIHEDLLAQCTMIPNLFLAGHWCTNGVGQGGISEVIYSGKNASKLILKDVKSSSVSCSSKGGV